MLWRERGFSFTRPGLGPRSRREAAAAKRVLPIVLALLLTGCGYHAMQSDYHWSSLYRPDVHTVAVPIFQSTDYHRGVEFQLTKALVNQLELHTPYKVVPRERADTILEGEIVS